MRFLYCSTIVLGRRNDGPGTVGMKTETRALSYQGNTGEGLFSQGPRYRTVVQIGPIISGIAHSRSHIFELLFIGRLYIYFLNIMSNLIINFFLHFSWIVIKFDKGLSLRLSAKASRVFRGFKLIWHFTPLVYIK